MMSTQETKAEAAPEKPPSELAALVGGLLWGPLGVLLAAVRANHPSAARVMGGGGQLLIAAWWGAILQVGILLLIFAL